MSAVIGVRVPKKLKEELEKLEINYSEEIRKFLEDLIRKKRAERVMRRLRELERSVGRVEGNLSVELVREDREGR
ncbi:MAG: antitoxin [Candidatus Korarchaeota archaeon]|nr:antitoxin [Candidatus Korarchaeota archaeon]